jgi:hypothetical protein
MTIRRFATNVTDNMTVSDHSGMAVHGELVINMDTNPPSLYIGDSGGNLNPITSVATVSGGNITGSIPADKISIVVDNGNGAISGGSQFLVNNSGNLVGSWLLALEEDDSRITSQANAFVFTRGEVNMASVDNVYLPDNGSFTKYNTTLPARNLQLNDATVIDSSGGSATNAVSVTINGQQYWIMLTTNP